MFKKLLSCLALATLIGGLSAQTQVFKMSGKRIQPINNSTAKSVMRITPTGNQFWCGYYAGNEELGGLGVQSSETYDCAIFIPNKGMFKGATISAIRFPLQQDGAYANVKAWLSTTLPESGSNFDVETDNVSSPIGLEKGYNEVALTKPYVITDKGIYVGITFDITNVSTQSDAFPIVAANTTAANSMFLRTSKTVTSWVDASGYGYGILALQVLLETPNGVKTAASISDADDIITIANSEQLMNLSLSNEGLEGINSFDYDVTFGDQTQSHHYGLSETYKSLYGTKTIKVPVNTPADCSYLKPVVKITKVNGVDNTESSNTSATCPLINIQYSAPHKSVMEEFTGTWCGYCPRGIVGMQNLAKIFGDKFIGIAVHGGSKTEPMLTSTYSPLLELISGYPSSFIDRLVSIDPYLGSQDSVGAFRADTNFKQMLDRLTEVELGLTSSWKGDNTIDLTTTINYYYNRSDNPYRLAYVIVEDSLSGTTSGWNQSNYYKGSTEWDSDLSEFINGPSTITGMKFDHVAHGIYDAMGIENSLTGALEIGKTVTHNYQIDVTKFSCPIQNRENVRAIVMIINSKTGAIVNAQEAKIGSQVGLNNITKDALKATVLNAKGMMTINTNVNEATNVAIYTADGSLVASKAFVGSTNILTSGLKGVYIVRVSNSKGASVRKVVL